MQVTENLGALSLSWCSHSVKSWASSTGQQDARARSVVQAQANEIAKAHRHADHDLDRQGQFLCDSRDGTVALTTANDVVCKG